MKWFAMPGYAGHTRSRSCWSRPGRDEVVSTPAIENFGMSLLADGISSSPAASTKSAGAGHYAASSGGVRRFRAGHAALLG